MSMDALDLSLVEAAALADELQDVDVARQFRHLRDRRKAGEWMVLLLGETSAGKSTWLNTVLGEAVLPATPGATTGVPVEVRWSDRAEPAFWTQFQDGGSRALTRDEFRAACLGGVPGVVRLRVDWPLSRRWESVREEELRGLVVVDAPGYNSCVREHAEILRDVLPEADAVVCFLNAIRGMTPEDLDFLRVVRRFGDGSPRHSLVVNWMPPSGGSARLAEMQQRLTAGLGAEVELHALEKTTSDSRVYLWSPAAWRTLAQVALSEERRKRIDENIAFVSTALLEELARALELTTRAAAVKEDELGKLEQGIARLTSLRQRARSLLANSTREMNEAITRSVDEGRVALWSEADTAIGDAGRFTNATDCGIWVRQHLLPMHFETTSNKLSNALERIGDRVAREIEELFADADLPELPEVDLADPQWQETRDLFARRGVHAAATELIGGQLAGFGGQGGAKAGFYNLSKKVIAKVGKVFGKKFSRAFYNNLGRMLRRVGLNGSVAIALGGAIILEGVAYVYGVARWKAKLRGVLQHTLDLPAEDEPVEDKLLRKLPVIGGEPEKPFNLLAKEARKAVDDAMTASAEILDKNLRRRTEVLTQSLAARRAGSIDMDGVRRQLQTLKRLAMIFEGETK